MHSSKTILLTLVLLFLPASLQAINIQINRQLMLYINPVNKAVMLTFVPDLPSIDEHINMRPEFRDLAQDFYLGHPEGLRIVGQQESHELQLLFPSPVYQFPGYSIIVGVQLSLKNAAGNPVSFNFQETISTLQQQSLPDDNAAIWSIHDQLPEVSIGNALSSPEVASALHTMLSGQYAARDNTFTAPNSLIVNFSSVMTPLSSGGWLEYIPYSWHKDINIGLIAIDSYSPDGEVLELLSHTFLYVTLTPITLSEHERQKVLKKGLTTVFKGKSEEEKTSDSIMQSASTAIKSFANWLGSKSHSDVKTVMVYTLSGLATLYNFLSAQNGLKSIFSPAIK